MVRLLLLAAVILLCGAGPCTLAAEPRILSERFDDWFYRCVEAADGKEKGRMRCETVQIAQTKQGEETINLLTLSLSETSQNKKRNTVLTVLAPLNVYLPAGVALSVDQGKTVNLTYRNCNNAGCWLQHLVTNAFLAELKAGQTGFAKFRLINGQNLNIKFSLKGISAALKALQSGELPKEKS